MSQNTRWERLVDALRDRIGAQGVEVWFKTARAVEFSEERLLVEVANEYYKEWISSNYSDDLRDIVLRVVGHPVDIQFTWADEPTADAPHTAAGPTPALPRSHGVHAHQTFDNFVIGECNKFAHAAACAVADHPARNYNPLFIYGATGLGKTHLMHALANRILANHPGSRAVYVTAEDFMNEMINSMRFKRMEDFRAKYRKEATVLLVDDVQFLASRERTQEEFFHTFNALQSSGRQIVLTSDVVPKDIDKLEPRLRTRFEGGLLADMQAPDKETLLAILAQKAGERRMHIPADLAEGIANAVAGNIRELEGLLNRLSALQTFSGRPITYAFAREQLAGVFDPAPPTVTVAGIIEAVARFHNIRSADITGSKRTRMLSDPRQIAMYLARTYTSLSFPELGREFGGRDHSTIQHGYRKVKAALDSHDPDIAYKVRLIEQALGVAARS